MLGRKHNSQELPISDAIPIWRSATAKLQTSENQVDKFWRMASAKLDIRISNSQRIKAVTTNNGIVQENGEMHPR